MEQINTIDNTFPQLCLQRCIRASFWLLQESGFIEEKYQNQKLDLPRNTFNLV